MKGTKVQAKRKVKLEVKPNDDLYDVGKTKEDYASCGSWLDDHEAADSDGNFTYIRNCISLSTYDCSKTEDKLVASYKAARGQASGDSQSNPVPGSCPANNNSGQFNTKSLFPDGSNPVTSPQGYKGQQH